MAENLQKKDPGKTKILDLGTETHQLPLLAAAGNHIVSIVVWQSGMDYIIDAELVGWFLDLCGGYHRLAVAIRCLSERLIEVAGFCLNLFLRKGL